MAGCNIDDVRASPAVARVRLQCRINVRGPQGDRHNVPREFVDLSVGAAEESWLRTGDLGFLCYGELFIVSRIKIL